VLLSVIEEIGSATVPVFVSVTSCAAAGTATSNGDFTVIQSPSWIR
jgi:hypothetical protein